MTFWAHPYICQSEPSKRPLFLKKMVLGGPPPLPNLGLQGHFGILNDIAISYNKTILGAHKTKHLCCCRFRTNRCYGDSSHGGSEKVYGRHQEKAGDVTRQTTTGST